MKIHSVSLCIGAALFALPLASPAQPSAHYVPGVEGIQGASLPPPGVYLRDYNVGYYSDEINDAKGNSVGPSNTRAFVFAQVPRLIWITDLQVLGGNIGVDGLVPMQYTSLRVGGFDDHTFGFGDAFGEATWSRHWKQFDVSAGYGAWAPTGSASTGTHNPTRAGLGYWTHMFTAGATWYPDTAKQMSLSALSRYEINMEHEGLTVGQAYTLEYGAGYAVIPPKLTVGASGYYQQQVTSDNNGAPINRVSGIGPEVVGFCPKCVLFVSLRYAYEFLAENRLQGHTIALTVTKKF